MGRGYAPHMSAGRLPPLARLVRAYVRVRMGASPPREPPDVLWGRLSETMSRRDLLRIGGVVGLGLAVSGCTGGAAEVSRSVPARHRTTPHDARVVVVGAGLAGVTAAYRLAAAGVSVELFEARDRVGGRCWTARGWADGQTAEHGGEFIDTRHVHLIGLAHELGLELDDLWEGYPRGAVWPSWVQGALLDHAAVKEQLDPIATAVEREARRFGVIREGRRPTDAAYSYGTATPAAVQLDRMSMAEWLERRVPEVIGSPIAAYLDEVMAGWYGLEMDGLSAINWIDYFVIPARGADERWHVRGGNDQVPNLAAEALPAGTLHLEAALEAMALRADGSYELRFGGVRAPVIADIVVLALPFSTLRLVDLTRAGLSPERLAAIEGLGMGMDAKLLLQYERRPSTFRVAGRTWGGGMEHTDPAFETWESSTDQPGRSGLITVYAGGRTGAGWTAPRPHGPAPAGLASAYVRYVDEVVPGTAAAFNGRAWADLWPRDPWTNGAYAAFLPGQYTRFWHFTGRPEGNVHFAGEHTSTYSQGYLNGGVESGDRAAIEVLRTLGLPVPDRLRRLPYSRLT